MDKNESPNLCVLFNVRLLTLAAYTPLEPLENALTSVDILLYPIPVLVTIASITLPFSTTGRTTAPAPAPVDITLTSGLELYSLPLLTTATSVILPFTIMGLNSAYLPFSIVTFGTTSLSRIVEP